MGYGFKLLQIWSNVDAGGVHLILGVHEGAFKR